MKQLSSGLVLMKTLLGWTPFEKMVQLKLQKAHNFVMSLRINDAKFSDLWRIDALRILDPNERGNR